MSKQDVRHIKIGNLDIQKIVAKSALVNKVILGSGDENGIILYENNNICDWATGTDLEIEYAILAHKLGLVNLYDYWKPGDERKVKLSSMTNQGIKSLENTVWILNGRQTQDIDTNPKYIPDNLIDTLDLENMPSMNSSYFLPLLEKPEDWDTSYTTYFYKDNGEYKLLEEYTDWKADTFYNQNASGCWDISFKFAVDYNLYHKAEGTKEAYWETKGDLWSEFSFNGLATDSSVSYGNSLCYYVNTTTDPKEFYRAYSTLESGYSEYVGYKHDTEESKLIQHFKIGDTYTVANVQKIKITGGGDVTNPDLINWLLKNAKCSSIENAESLDWQVSQEQPEQWVTLSIAQQCRDENGNNISAYSLSDSDVSPLFILSQKEVLSVPGEIALVKREKVYTGSLSSITTTLKKGYGSSTNNKALNGAVKQLQTFLNWYDTSFGLKVDGVYGDKLVEAVTKFQTAEQITADGTDGQTFSEVSLNAAKKYLDNGSSSNVGGWDTSARKKWCQGAYFTALPAQIRKLLSTFNYEVYAGNPNGAVFDIDSVTTSANIISLPICTNIFTDKPEYCAKSEWYSKGGIGNYPTWEYCTEVLKPIPTEPIVNTLDSSEITVELDSKLDCAYCIDTSLNRIVSYSKFLLQEDGSYLIDDRTKLSGPVDIELVDNILIFDKNNKSPQGRTYECYVFVESDNLKPYWLSSASTFDSKCYLTSEQKSVESDNVTNIYISPFMII